MRAARTMLFSGAFSLQTFCSLALADLPPTGTRENPSIKGVKEYAPTDPREALFLRRITEYWKEGHFDDAKKQLLSYLSQYPASAYLNEIYAMLGDLYLRDGSLEEAAKSYEKIVSKRCQQLTAQHYIECLHQMEKYEALISWIATHPVDSFSLEPAQKEQLHLLLADTHYRITQKEENPDSVQLHAKLALEEFSKISHLNRDWELAVAYLYALTGERKAAAERYELLCQEFPEKKAELLFQAALLLNKDDPAKSISLLQEADGITSPLQEDAAFNELLLLFREKRYEEFLSREVALKPFIGQRASELFSFYRGSSHFYLEHYEDASVAMREYLSTNPSSKDELRFALQSLVVCSYKKKDIATLEDTLYRWKKELTLDEGYLDGLFALSEILLQEKQYAKAGNALTEILGRDISNTKQEIALFDYGQVLILQGQFTEGKNALEQYLVRFSTSPRASIVWQNLIFADFEILKTGDKSQCDVLRAGLAADLQKALVHKEQFTPEVVRVYRLNLAQLLFELDDCREALEVATLYVEQYPDHESAQGLRLMQIACHVALSSPADKVVPSVLSALENEANPQIQTKLRLQLFNAYLALNDLEKAEEYLFAVYNTPHVTLKKENLLWLAQRMEQKQQLPLAEVMIENALSASEGCLVRDPSMDPFLMEEEALHLKEVYLTQGKVDKAIQILTGLIDIQSTDSSVSWKLARRVQFELGELFEQQGRFDEALMVYKRLIGDAAYSQASYFLRAALLNQAKLQFARLSQQEFSEQSQDFLGILGTLKDLQIAKSVESEPIHLEAALEYANIRCRLVLPEMKNKKMAFYLERIQEDFLMASSDASSSYLKDRENWPEQNSLIENYLRYIGAERKRLRGIEALESDDLERSQMLTTEAKMEMESLDESLKNARSLLSKRVKESLALLGETN